MSDLIQAGNVSPGLFLGHASVVILIPTKAAVTMVTNPPNVKDGIKGVVTSPMMGKDTRTNMRGLPKLPRSDRHPFWLLIAQLASAWSNQTSPSNSPKDDLLGIYLFRITFPVGTRYPLHCLTFSGRGS